MLNKEVRADSYFIGSLKLLEAFSTSHANAKCNVKCKTLRLLAFVLVRISSVFCIKSQLKLLLVSVVSKDTTLYVMFFVGFCVSRHKC